MMLRPIEIIGGGLAGLSLALALRRHDVSATVYEAAGYPRHRVCGEFIAGLHEETIIRLGLGPLLADALRHREVAWFFRGNPVRIQRLPAAALGISRYTLDARLAAAFVDAGGTLRTRTRVTDRAPRPGRVYANGRRPGRSRWLGLKVHVRRLDLERDLELHLGDDCYVGVARVENGCANVCGLFRRGTVCGRGSDLLLAYLRAAGLDKLAARLAAAEICGDAFCAMAALDFDRAVPRTDRVLLGDACAMIPPFTGNGMAMAFQSAESALDPLLAFARGESDWVETCRATQAAQRGRFRLRLTSADALHPFLLRPRRQRLLAALSRTHLLPLGPLYRMMH